MPLVIGQNIQAPLRTGIEQPIQQAGEQPQIGINPAQINQAQQQGRQVIGQRSLREIGPGMSTAQQNLEHISRRWADSAPPRTMPKTIGLTMPPLGNTLQVDSTMVEHEIKALPRNQRQEAVQNMPRVVQERVNNGYKIWNEVQSGTRQGAATLEDVRDLITFLNAKGMEKSDGFSEGAFNIPDPNHRLRNFLDSCPEVYQRPSSHLEGFQEAPGGGHRGIDVRAGVSLPYGKATLLYGALTDGVQGMQGDRLFLKTEDHGCRLAAIKSPNRDPNILDRPKRFGDIGQFLGHAGGFFRTVLRTLSGGRLFANAPDSRKERIPSDIGREYKSIIRTLDRAGQNAIADQLRHHAPLSNSQGVRTMAANLDAALAGGNLDDATRTAMQSLRDKLGARFDHLNVRIGNEVVLDQAELTGMAPRNAATGLARAAINGLLAIPDPAHLTETSMNKFAQQLAKIATALDTEDADHSTASMVAALDAATAHLSQTERAHVAALLDSPQLRNVMVGMDMIFGAGASNIEGLDDATAIATASAARKISHTYLALGSRVGLDPNRNLGEDTLEGLMQASQIVVSTGVDANLARNVALAVASRKGQTQMAGQALGLMSSADVRSKIGPGIVTVGEHIQTIARGEVNQEQIAQVLLTGLQEDLRTAGDNGLANLTPVFVADFLRNGLSVNGQRYGGTGTNIPAQQQLEALQEFIDAVGGLAVAQQVARVTYQARLGDLQVALNADPGYTPLLQEYTQYPGGMLYPLVAGRPASMNISIITNGTDVGVQIDASSQKVGDTLTKNYEMSLNQSMAYTIQGAGTNDPVVRLDHWDAIFSTTPQRRIVDMDMANLRAVAQPFAMDTRVQAILGSRNPDRAAMTTHLAQNLTTELGTARTPGYRGLPTEFIGDFFRREIVVNGQAYGGGGSETGGTAELTATDRARLDAFIQAVGGEERAKTIAKVTFQNIPGTMDESLRSDPAVADVDMQYLTHSAVDVTPTVANFTITTHNDDSVDIHLDYRQQKGVDPSRGYEFGKNGYLEYTLSALDTQTPVLQLGSWNMYFGTTQPQ